VKEWELGDEVWTVGATVVAELTAVVVLDGAAEE
jgi:hypothetical protein